MKVIGWIVVTVLAWFVIAFTNGWALSTLWGWFVVPLFEVRQLRIVEAVGLNVVVRFVVYTHDTSKKDERKYAEILLTGAYMSVVMALLTVAFSWPVTLFL